MKSKEIAILNMYPTITWYTEAYCKKCSKSCYIPSFEMYSCALKRLERKDKEYDKRG